MYSPTDIQFLFNVNKTPILINHLLLLAVLPPPLLLLLLVHSSGVHETLLIWLVPSMHANKFLLSPLPCT